jgi:hypothetical protein
MKMKWAEHRKTMFVEIHERGHELASHGKNHINLTDQLIDTILTEIVDSKIAIEELTGEPCVSYVAPYGALTQAVINEVRRFYISAIGPKEGMNDIADSNMFNLRIGPVPRPWGSTWTDEEYLGSLEQYLEAIVDNEAWGIEMWHNINIEPQLLNSQASANEFVFRTHFESLVSEYDKLIWVASQGTIARYIWERDTARVYTILVSPCIIKIAAICELDPDIYDLPLSISVCVPQFWMSGHITVFQHANEIAVDVMSDGEIAIVIINAIPDGCPVTLQYEPQTQD